MRTYATYWEVESEIKRDLKELAVVYQSKSVQDMDVSNDPGYLTHELMNYTYSLIEPESAWEDLPERLEEYVTAEFAERMGPIHLNPGLSWKVDADYWQQFLHNGKFSYTYSERMVPYINAVKVLLQGNSETRQAWLPIWHPDDLLSTGGDIRVPCSLGYHLMVRQGSLHLHYVMRSCDFIKHFRKDVVLAVLYQNFFRQLLQVSMGYFTHTIFSLHAFAKDLEGVF